jgi:hypothetical protein
MVAPFSSFQLACLALSLLAGKNAELTGLLGEVIQALVSFYALVGLCGNIVMWTMTKRGAWFLLSAFSIALLVIDFFEAAFNAKHWGNF